MDIPILKDIVILMAVSVPMSIVLTRFGLPSLVGFLLTGVLIGPHGLALITQVHEVELLAEIGVVLLLFTIGLEFSVAKMIKIKKEAMVGGGLQLGITILISYFVSQFFGLSVETSLLISFAIGLSSSAIVLKLLVDKGEVNSSHGTLTTGILLFQDICVVLMVMVIQGMGEEGKLSPLLMVKEVGIAIAAVFVIVITVNYLAPKLFDVVVKLRNREVFMLTIVLVCLGTAWLTSLFGLSLAIGAFIAGLIISESEYSHQIVAEVLPFRDMFSSLFFISVGMLLELEYFIYNIHYIIPVALAIILLKSLVVVGAGQILKYPLRLSIIVGLSIAQIGEFSFILIKMGEGYGFLTGELYQMFLAVSILTMSVTPFLYQFATPIAFRVSRVFGTKVTGYSSDEKKTTMENHVVIIGYGVNGKNLAGVLKSTYVDHIILDTNISRVTAAKADGHKAYFGDSSHHEILKKSAIEKARILVVGITDSVATRRTVKTARDLAPSLTIVVRTRYVKDMEDLYKLGADTVIPEEFETSIEIFSCVLKDFRIPANIIQNQIDLVRGEGYAMFRSLSSDGDFGAPKMSTTSTDKLSNLAKILELSVMDTFFVEDDSKWAGVTIDGLGLSAAPGVRVMAVVRGGKAKTNPRKDYEIEKGDILVILGNHSALNSAMEILKC